MFERDTYEFDYTTKYWSDLHRDRFNWDFYSPEGKMLQLMVYSSEEREAIKEMQSFQVNCNLFTMGLSLIPIIFWKRMPLLSRIEKRWKRVLISIPLFLVPVSGVHAFTQIDIDKGLTKIYNKYGLKHNLWVKDGDLKIFENVAFSMNI